MNDGWWISIAVLKTRPTPSFCEIQKSQAYPSHHPGYRIHYSRTITYNSTVYTDTYSLDTLRYR